MRIFKSAFSFLLFIFVYSCGRDAKPKDILSPEIFRSVFWEISKASVYATEYIRLDSLKNDSIELDEMKRVILAKYKITEAVYQKSRNYYTNHPEEMIKLIDTLQTVEKKRKKINRGMRRQDSIKNITNEKSN